MSVREKRKKKDWGGKRESDRVRQMDKQTDERRQPKETELSKR